VNEAQAGATMNLAKTSEGKAAEIDQLIAPSLCAMGYNIVRVLISGKEHRVLQIMAERQSDGGMSVGDCTAVSRAVSAILDVEDPIAGSYTLEVSSAGLDRPLTRLADFERFSGFEAKIEMESPIDGRRRFSGPLRGVDGEMVLIDTEEGVASLAFAGIAKAKLLLTDKLLAAQAAPAQRDDH
jgi:ribosome maturation factor RimP